MNTSFVYFCIFLSITFISSCSVDQIGETKMIFQNPTSIFGNNIDLNNLENYNDEVPNYIRKDINNGRSISDAKATVGRVLFYDKKLSIDNSISCSSCHIQNNGFTDPELASSGVEGGTTGRHSMRLVNLRYGVENKFFWDERAPSLMDQTTMPIKDHAEMGYSGEDGRPGFNDLLLKLENTEYYNTLFDFAYGNNGISEERIQECLSEFLLSIQSFDTKYDDGRSQVGNDRANFPNFSRSENNGKTLFLAPPVFNNQGQRTGGGLGCAGCHQPPEFNIDPISKNNGIIGSIGGGTDLSVTRSPSLRSLFDISGTEIGPFMHDGSLHSLSDVLDHYNEIDARGNNNLDRRLRPNGRGQNLNMTAQEKNDVIQFLQTLTGKDVFENEKWSNPFKGE